MNVAIINIKDIIKYFAKILIIIFILFIATKCLLNLKQDLGQTVFSSIDNNFLIKCLEKNILCFQSIETTSKEQLRMTSLMNLELPILKQCKIETTVTNAENTETIKDKVEETQSSQIEISKVAQTKEVDDRNFISNATNYYGTTRIDNQSDYTITEEMLVPDVEISNKKNVIIYHTHTCESYIPCEKYNYTMTGNYRTTDYNYNIVRVGKELTTYLTKKGFNVVHDGTYHDYPSYSGSYSRSLETANRLLESTPAEIVFDLHRDAIGNGDTYGPTVMINEQRVAQLMFVIGTDGGGLEHPNWVNNLKIAVKIQEKANEMYPGLFRSIIIRNSRYNQHVANGASIIEVGATANTLDECLLSMQCLANIMEEVCK